MERLILEFSIRTALAALGIAAILGLLRVRTAAARHAAWAGLVLFMLVLPMWTAWGPKAAVRVLPAPAMEPRASIAASAEASAAPMTEALVIPSVASTPPPPGFGWSLWNLVWGIYAAGALWLLTRLGIGTIRAKHLTGADCVAPVTVGLLRPRVILPQGWSEWTPGQLDAILAHEHAHVRRRDPLLQWLALLNRALFWFHPLAWWVERRLAALAEEACDDAVLERGHDAAEYAEYLLDMERSVKAAGARVPVLGMTMPGSGLPRRIRLIFDGPRWPRMSRTRMLCAVAACSATAAVFGAGTLERMPELQFPLIRPEAVQAPGLDAIPMSIAAEAKGGRVLLAQSTSGPQAPARPQGVPTPKFEVAAIRPCKGGDSPERRGGNGELSPGRLSLACLTVDRLIWSAYVLFANDRYNGFAPDTPVLGGPSWAKSDGYQIDAKAEGPQSWQTMSGSMLRALLEDRFKLKLHRETREVPVYALTVAKGGPKLQPFKEGTCMTVDPNDPEHSPFPRLEPGQPLPLICGMGRLTNGYDFSGVTMATFSRDISFELDRPVIDRTGIAGMFTIHLDLSAADLGRPDPNSSDPAAPPTPIDRLATVGFAVEKLGLKLESSKGPGEFIVVDSVERPSED